MRLLALFLSLFVLSGCASKDYALYAETQHKIAQANAVAETARFAALAEIGKSGSDAAKVAAVLSIQMGGAPNNSPKTQNVAPPESWGDVVFKWSALVVPQVTQFYSIHRNSAVAMRQSDNAAATAQSTNQAMVNIAKSGTDSNATIAGAGFSAINTSNTAGFNALRDSSTSSNNSLSNLGIAGFNSLGTVASKIQAPAPNQTIIHGNGVIGSGTYGVSGNSGANSGNTGKLSGTTLTDQTSTPTVVKEITTTTTTTSSTTSNTTSNTNTSTNNTGGGN